MWWRFLTSKVLAMVRPQGRGRVTPPYLGTRQTASCNSGARANRWKWNLETQLKRLGEQLACGASVNVSRLAQLMLQSDYDCHWVYPLHLAQLIHLRQTCVVWLYRSFTGIEWHALSHKWDRLAQLALCCFLRALCANHAISNISYHRARNSWAGWSSFFLAHIRL